MNKKGKILRIKTGYNPNSSSIGSHIPTFFAIATSVGIMTIIIVNQIRKTNKRIQDKKANLESGKAGGN